MAEKLAAEILDASNGEAAIRKKEAVHKMAESNKALLFCSIINNLN